MADMPLLMAGAAAPPTSSFLIQILPFIAIFAIFYFLLIRPQQRRAKEHREMVANLRRGDVVVTHSGLIGKIKRVGDVEMTLEVADGVAFKMLKGAVSEVRAKTELADDDPANDTETEKQTDDAKV